MLVLGLNTSYHDTAAVLMEDGRVLAAIEEERLSRVKHTTAFPTLAIQACLAEAGADLGDVDLIALNVAEESIGRTISRYAHSQRVPAALTPAAHAASWFTAAGLTVDPRRLRFVPHHVAHAASAWFYSGFDDALVLSIDGLGEDSEYDYASGIVFRARDGSLCRLRTFKPEESLGLLYGQITKFLGFAEFDEYKVMGLASYGDASVYDACFRECYRLTPDGWYEVDRMRLAANVRALLDASADRTVLRELHGNIAAACQRLLETVVCHVAAHYARETGARKLALAGGVALNCALTARIIESRVFEDVFVQPASHDAGGALGAAAYVMRQEATGKLPNERLRAVNWGISATSPEKVADAFHRWRHFVSIERPTAVTATAAKALAAGQVIGWIQGRSEFGPRALGHRSILADPRPARNREVVNRIVKKREEFRPFAPSVLVEMADEYFEMPDGYRELPFMGTLVRVRAAYRTQLQAITHVDGTARIQTIDRAVNARYWDLVREFGDLTGIYALLNTSFNNNAEPIVDSVDDALVAYLTMNIDALVVDDCWVTKRDVSDEALLDLVPEIARCAEFGVTSTRNHCSCWSKYRDEEPLAARRPVALTWQTFEVMSRADGVASVRALLERCRNREENPAVIANLRTLWWHRLIRLQPPDEARRVSPLTSVQSAEERC